MPEPTAERIEPGAEAARRDDLARDVARMWAAVQRNANTQSRVQWLPPDLTNALHLLEQAYRAEGEETVTVVMDNRDARYTPPKD